VPVLLETVNLPPLMFHFVDAQDVATTDWRVRKLLRFVRPSPSGRRPAWPQDFRNTPVPPVRHLSDRLGQKLAMSV
jgi:hypothetical protein